MAESAQGSSSPIPTNPRETRPYGRLHQRLVNGEWAITAEVVPPRGAGLDGIRRVARSVRDWVDAANVTDGQSAEVRLPSWAACICLLQEAVEPVVQLTCRDRNRIALQSDLLGVTALGIPNVSVMTGDDIALGDDPQAKPVFDLDTIGLIRTISRLRDEGTLASGRELSTRPRCFIGVVEDPFGPDSVARLEKKVEAGAQFVQTQFVFDTEGFGRWMKQLRERRLDKRCYVIASVATARTLHTLEHLKSLPGVHVPESVERRLLGVDEDKRESEAISLCAETVQALKETAGVAGVHVIAAGAELPEVLRRAGIGRRTPLTVGSASSTIGGRS
jgi:methylenetetrahydrofolate reductase (NADPH)